MAYQLLTTNNPKTIKGFKKYNNILTAIMHLRPISTKICPYQEIASCMRLVFSPFLNIPPRPAVFKHAVLQPAMSWNGHILVLTGRKCMIAVSILLYFLKPFIVFGLLVVNNLYDILAPMYLC